MSKDTTAFQTTATSRGRHPLLKAGTVPYQIYYHLKAHPGDNVPSMTNLFGEPYYTIKGAVTKLKSEGLVVDGKKVKGPNNRLTPSLFTVPENETGYARDKVEVLVSIYVNEYGEYSAKAEIKNQMPTAGEDNPRLIHMVDQTISVPKPNEYRPRIVQTSASDEALVIDADFEETTRDKDNT